MVSPVTRYRHRTKKEFLGTLENGAGKRILSRVPHHVLAKPGAERIELYKDHLGWHIVATYKEEIER